MKTTTKQACQLHSHEAFANVMGLVISVVWYLQADIPVIMHLRHLSVNCTDKNGLVIVLEHRLEGRWAFVVANSDCTTILVVAALGTQ